MKDSAYTKYMSLITPVTGGSGSIFTDIGSSGVLGFANQTYGVIFSYLTYAAGAVVLIYLVLGGIKYLQAGADAKKVAAARATIMSAIIGAAIIIGAYTLINIGFAIANLVSGFEKGKAVEITPDNHGGVQGPEICLSETSHTACSAVDDLTGRGCKCSISKDWCTDSADCN
jgi:hypothetical protein